MTKPRSDSKLFILPAEEQKEIYNRLRYDSYAVVRDWLIREKHIGVSVATLSNAWEVWSRQELEERVLKAKGAADDVMELIDNPDQLDAALALALKQSAFEMVMQRGDPKTIKNFCTILLNDQKLKHDQAALDLKLRQYEDQISAAKAELTKAKKTGGMTVEAIEKMEQTLGLL